MIRVAIFEDNNALRDSMSGLIEATPGYIFTSAYPDAKRIGPRIRESKPDVVLMDINMPLLNGFETTRLIRNKNNTTPIIALTAFDKEEISEEAISAGMNDIIIKPFDQSKLFKAMSTLIYDAKNVG